MHKGFSTLQSEVNFIMPLNIKEADLVITNIGNGDIEFDAAMIRRGIDNFTTRRLWKFVSGSKNNGIHNLSVELVIRAIETGRAS